MYVASSRAARSRAWTSVPEGTPGAAVISIRKVDELGFYNLGALLPALPARHARFRALGLPLPGHGRALRVLGPGFRFLRSGGGRGGGILGVTRRYLGPFRRVRRRLDVGIHLVENLRQRPAHDLRPLDRLFFRRCGTFGGHVFLLLGSPFPGCNTIQVYIVKRRGRERPGQDRSSQGEPLTIR